MKKRIFAAVLATALLFASVMGVSAANSKVEGVSLTEACSHNHIIEPKDQEFIGTPEAVKAVIKELDANKITSLPAEIQGKLAGKKNVTGMFDVDHIGTDTTACPNGHDLVLKVDALTKDMKGIVILHYNEGQSKWETFDPKVDYDNKTLSFTAMNLSPMGVFADVKGGTGNGTSPATEGTSSAWMLMVAIALVAAGACVVGVEKKRR